MSTIQLEQVSKSFGDVEIIKPLDLVIEDGEFMVFVGPSGCGKSTLLRLIAGLEDVTSGTIKIGGAQANDLPASKRELAMVFQSYALYPHMTVRQNILFPMKMAKLDKKTQEDRLNYAAELLNLSSYLARKPGQLSGGQRQRVAIGRAIVREPKAFLFDEPLSNLDAALRVDMRAGISELHRKLGTTMVYVTHDQVEALTLADKIAVLRDGEIEQVGTPMELYETPKNMFVAGFIGSPKINFLNGDGFDCHKIGVRPEHLDLSSSKGMWTGIVTSAEHLGSDSFLYLKVDQSTEPVIVRSADRLTARIGETVYLSPKEGSIHKFDQDSQRI